MPEPILYRNSMPIAIVQVLQAVLPAAATASMLALIARSAHVPFDGQYVGMAAVAAALALGIFAPAHGASYYLTISRPPVLISTAVKWIVLLATLLLIGYFLKVSAHYSRRVIGVWIIVTPLVLTLIAALLHQLMRRVLLDRGNARHAVLVGYNDLSRNLARRLGNLSMRVQGYFDDRSFERLGAEADAPLLGHLRELPEYVKRESVDVIFIVLPIRHIPRVLKLVDELRDTTASIYYVPDIYVFDLIQARTTDVMGIPVVAMCETPLSGYRGVSKRLLDVVVASTGLVLIAPLLLTIALAVKLTSRGPVIFRQRRYGLDGRSIVVYKFRSMTVIEDGPRIVQASRNDPRITPVGKFLRRFSLDELPQIINVIQGRMSLVGPRPHAVAHNEEYRKLIKGYMVRHKVLPGITGWAQVNGYRGETADVADMQARVNYDLEYLRRWSVTFDLRILARTVIMVIWDRKAF
jgi:putative colanic acid biosysnthesis UDP-glucose lipid carrier transferase